MPPELLRGPLTFDHHLQSSVSRFHLHSDLLVSNFQRITLMQQKNGVSTLRQSAMALRFARQRSLSLSRAKLRPVSASLTELDLTEENVKQVLGDARVEFGQIFDPSVGITGEAQLAELDGPFVKIRLTGKFWHKRSTVLARLATYLKQRIPEILEVDIEDEKQLDDSPENF